MHDRNPQPDDPHIPAGLARDLHRLDARSLPAWPGDDPVLAAARAGGSRRGPWRLVGWSAGLTAAAAGLAISALVWFNPPTRHAPARGAESPSIAGRPAAGDGTGLGAAPASPVTMLDAYRLTLMLDRLETPSAAWDADADGRVTPADVDALAARAVSLQETSS